MRIKDIGQRIANPQVLLWLLPIVLIVPNVALAITEQWHWLAKITGIVLPLGFYILLASCSKRIGRTVLWCIPLMIYCAFEIVLLFLYGESIIAIDMFLNVMTTNFSEATELLGNLLQSIFCVVVLYIPPIILGIILTCSKKHNEATSLRRPRIIGGIITAIGAVLLILSYIFVPHYRIDRQLFPVNVISNNITAIARAHASTKYPKTSTEFSYRSSLTRDKETPEVYVLVIGETSRADNWQIFGYERPTNPLLSERQDILTFPYAVSESNTTHKSVPILLSYLNADNFGDSIATTKSLISAFNEAGYRTAFISNQRRNHSYIEYFGNEAQVTRYIIDESGPQIDSELLPMVRDFIEASPNHKVLIVLHTYGSHFNYKERYPPNFSVFTPDNASGANEKNRSELINAYDNTILYTDFVLNSLINMLDSTDCVAGMLYLSDHGEDIFDDSRSRFLHASPNPTFHQIHAPYLIWMSDELRHAYPELYENAADHRSDQISSSRTVFNTFLQMAGIQSPYLDYNQSLVDSTYTPIPRRYITDYNEGVPLTESGLRDVDYQEFAKAGISVE